MIAHKETQRPVGAHIVHSALLSDGLTAQTTAPSAAERCRAIRRLRPGSRIGHRHLRPSGYQGPVNHLYDSSNALHTSARPFGPTAPARRPAHEQYAAIGSRRALAQRLNEHTERKKSRVHRPTTPQVHRPTSELSEHPGHQHCISVIPARSQPLGSRAALLQRLANATHTPASAALPRDSPPSTTNPHAHAQNDDQDTTPAASTLLGSRRALAELLNRRRQHRP